MPKVRRHNLPRPLYAHLLDRLQQREFSGQQLARLIAWLDQQPEVPQGKWFKRFSGLTVCGEGEFIKNFLLPNQAPLGEEVR